jgi:hypothetical protein
MDVYEDTEGCTYVLLFNPNAIEVYTDRTWTEGGDPAAGIPPDVHEARDIRAIYAAGYWRAVAVELL